MENNNVVLSPIDTFGKSVDQKSEVKRELPKTPPILDLTKNSLNEPVAEEIQHSESTKEKDQRSLKEKISAALKREREVFEENKAFNREAAKSWVDNKKSGVMEIMGTAKSFVTSAPKKLKAYFAELPSKAKSIPEKTREICKDKDFAKRAVVAVLLGIWALIVLFPFYYMIITSLKDYPTYSSETDILSKLFATAPTLESYSFAMSTVSLGRYFLNTLIFTLATTAIMLVVTVLASYGFARINFKGKNIIFTAFLSMMMIPAELVVITNFITITNMNLRNTFMGLILPSITSVFYIYLLKENFQQVPNELYYAAKVDGTTDFKYLFKVMIPICQPTIVTVTILKVIECWNSYVWPRLITDEEKYYLVSNGIQAIRESGFGRDNVPAMMSAVVIVSIPLILLFLIFRNKIMEGVARGGTKG